MPYYFVEGHLERKFVQNACKGSRVRLIQLNGKSVSLTQIATQITSIYRTMQACVDPIVVIFDREKRTESSEEIANQVMQLLAREGIQALVAIPDRCIETWILYDPDVSNVPEKNYEGVMGATLLKESLGSYSKSTDGPKLLKACKAEKLLNSASFKRLADSLQFLDCWWLGSK